MTLVEAAVLLAAYLIGSIPFSFLVARTWGVEDVRKVGSGNVGATNVLRSAGKAAGFLAFALDFLKGALGTGLGLYLAPGGALPAWAAVGVVVGHVFPVWLGFRGGKGVATGAGAFLPLVPAATGAGILAFALALGATRYVSVSSIMGTVTLAAVVLLAQVHPGVKFAAAILALLVVWKHRENLVRVARGTENRLGGFRP